VHDRERTAEEERVPVEGGAISQRETIQRDAHERRRGRQGDRVRMRRKMKDREGGGEWEGRLEKKLNKKKEKEKRNRR